MLHPPPARAYIAYQPGGHSHHKAVIWHRGCHHGACRHQGEAANRDTGQHDGACADGRAAPHQGWSHFPVIGGLEMPIGRDGAREAIIGQTSQRSYEDTVLDRGAVIDLSPVLDLDVVTDYNIEVHVDSLAHDAILADRRALPHLCLVPNAGSLPNPGSTSVKIVTSIPARSLIARIL
jgi:hypothetical protein